MNEKLTTEQNNNLIIASSYLEAASKILLLIDKQVQSEGTTGPNKINHTAFDLENTASFIDSWVKDGVEL